MQNYVNSQCLARFPQQKLLATCMLVGRAAIGTVTWAGGTGWTGWAGQDLPRALLESRMRTEIDHQILARSSSEASWRLQFVLKSTISDQILARSSPETSWRLEFVLKSTTSDQILARSSPEAS